VGFVGSCALGTWKGQNKTGEHVIRQTWERDKKGKAKVCVPTRLSKLDSGSTWVKQKWSFSLVDVLWVVGMLLRCFIFFTQKLTVGSRAGAEEELGEEEEKRSRWSCFIQE
jgi:hypothetical protein